MGSAPSALSMVRVTSARPSGARPAVPAKMTSSILPPRSALAPCSPSTQEIASTTLDLPEPLGPTTQVIPGSSFIVVADAKDLKPLTVRLLRCTELHRLGRLRPAATTGQDTAGRLPTLAARHTITRVSWHKGDRTPTRACQDLGQKAARRQPRE